MVRRWEYGTMDYTEEGDEVLAEKYRTMPADRDGIYHDHDPIDEPDDCGRCGYQEGTFACRVRHVQVNTGAAKAARD